MMTPGLRPAYLCVDEFLRDVVGARSLQSAIELGMIDFFQGSGVVSRRVLASRFHLEPRALELLLGMLHANGVIEQHNDELSLCQRFREALDYRDLLEAKLEFAALVVSDFIEMCTPLLADPGHFFEQARIFELFSYDRCFEATPENVAMTRRWVRFTSALTRYEAQSCIQKHDFSHTRRLLDVGGNSGEFVLRVCRAHAGVHATVLDLPVVCRIGQAHVGGEAEAARIDFIETQGTDAEFPSGFDTVCFKSMLHDWPDPEMRSFLERAHRALEPGGRLVIFERGLLEVGASQLPYSLIPIMLFFRSYRSGEDYLLHLRQIGFRDIVLQTIELEMPFLLITATK